ncbi:hypothetical protein KAR91_66780 [Candidatus Pacearchaeota archaeon]|nr:hypothetical protein [Candidatus Pacearchaeota archaeon]
MRLIFIMLVAGLLTGCTLSHNLKDKSVNSEFWVYGLKATAFDPSTGSMAPTGFFGFGKVYYHSCPVKAGQPFKVTRKHRSVWNASITDEVIIEIGAAPADGKLEVSGGEILGIPYSPSAIYTQDNSATVSPDKK